MDSHIGVPPTAAQRIAVSSGTGLDAPMRPIALRQGAHITACPLVRQLAPAARYVLRGGPQVMTATGSALGLEISSVACRAATNGVDGDADPAARHRAGNAADTSSAARKNSTAESPPAAATAPVAALWLGPDEQLLLGAEGADIATALEPALRALPHSLVDVSHRQTALQVSGPHATRLLSTGCPLDLDLASFPVGMCTRTVLAKAEIVLWRTSEHVFHIEVWRSFAAYVSEFLAEAAREIASPKTDSGDLQ
jgi:sarcosine oxidase subunit gamma